MLVKERESLVHFDHVLDVIGRAYQLAVDFAHAPRPLTLALAITRSYMHEQSTILKIDLLTRRHEPLEADLG